MKEASGVVDCMLSRKIVYDLMSTDPLTASISLLLWAEKKCNKN